MPYRSARAQRILEHGTDVVEGKNTAHLMDTVYISVWTDDAFALSLAKLCPGIPNPGMAGAGGACSCSSGKTQAAIRCIHAELW